MNLVIIIQKIHLKQKQLAYYTTQMYNYEKYSAALRIGRNEEFCGPAHNFSRNYYWHFQKIRYNI